jgi:hypothetical protein
MHNILNPSDGASGEHMTSSAGNGGQSIGRGPSSPRVRKRPVAESPTRELPDSLPAAGARRVLTPKSPGLRAASLGARGAVTSQPVASSAHLLGPEPRIYTAEPGTADIPSLPPISAPGRGNLPGINTAELPPLHSRSTLGQSATASAFPATRSDSPSTSHTSLSQSEQVSPAYRYGPLNHTQGGARTRGGLTASDLVSEGLQSSTEGYTTGQPAYQMTLETEQGPMVVPVELDLQQASKVADEKRKRNAGASARFRARRKEKEKESSQRISELQQELRELREDRDFYRNERNVLREFAASRLGLAQLPPRPASPSTRRPMRSTTELSRQSEEPMRARSDSAPAAQRRRRSEYPATYGPPMQSPSQMYSSTYPPPILPPQQSVPTPLPPPIPVQNPSGPFVSPRQLPPGPPGLPGPPIPPPLGSRTQSYDPFRKDPYDRTWNPGH